MDLLTYALLDKKITAARGEIAKDTTSTEVEVTAQKDKAYIFGELEELEINWGTGEDGSETSFIFKSGSTPTTLSVSSTGAVFDSFTPSASAIVEINAKWYLDKWVVLFHETGVSA